MIFEYHSKSNKRTGKFQLWTHENHAIKLTRARHSRNVINLAKNNNHHTTPQYPNTN